MDRVLQHIVVHQGLVGQKDDRDEHDHRAAQQEEPHASVGKQPWDGAKEIYQDGPAFTGLPCQRCEEQDRECDEHRNGKIFP
ncbi:MAG: hypothetical protein IPF64_04755 [Flavobacteriales bacterium]|nr:hypothetical protein [Flavobacteriales bacterium]